MNYIRDYANVGLFEVPTRTLLRNGRVPIVELEEDNNRETERETETRPQGSECGLSFLRLKVREGSTGCESGEHS